MSYSVTPYQHDGRSLGTYTFPNQVEAEEYSVDLLLSHAAALCTRIVETQEPPDSLYVRGDSGELGSLSRLDAADLALPSDDDLDRQIQELIRACDLDSLGD